MSPTSHPPSCSHSSLSDHPAALWMAPSTPPPPIRDELAALTTASISSVVMSPRHKDTLSFRSGFTEKRGSGSGWSSIGDVIRRKGPGKSEDCIESNLWAAATAVERFFTRHHQKFAQQMQTYKWWVVTGTAVTHSTPVVSKSYIPGLSGNLILDATL